MQRSRRLDSAQKTDAVRRVRKDEPGWASRSKEDVGGGTFDEQAERLRPDRPLTAGGKADEAPQVGEGGGGEAGSYVAGPEGAAGEEGTAGEEKEKEKGPEGKKKAAVEGPVSGSLGTISSLGVSKSMGDPEESTLTCKADFGLSFSTSRTSSAGAIAGAGVAKGDTGASDFTLTFSQVGGRSVSPFGSEFFEPKFTGSSFKCDGGVCTIKATLKIDCPWGTDAGGRTDIPSGSAGVITKTNYEDVRDDLMPSSASPHKSPRATYFSKSLVERHEKFHGTDDWGWAQKDGLDLVKKKIEGTTIDKSKAAKEVEDLLKACIKLLEAENWKFYTGGGSSHSSYAGEIRAYGDGKPHYEKLAKEVESHGKTL